MTIPFARRSSFNKFRMSGGSAVTELGHWLVTVTDGILYHTTGHREEKDTPVRASKSAPKLCTWSINRPSSTKSGR